MALILIVDDDRRFRAMLRAMLTDAGHRVLEAGDGDSGVETFRRERPDVALVDIIMPGKGGISTIGEIHMLDPTAKIVAMSGGDPRGPLSDLPIAWAYGAARSLRKPFGRTVLLATLAELLGEVGHTPEVSGVQPRDDAARAVAQPAVIPKRRVPLK